MTRPDRDKWNERYRSGNADRDARPARVLEENAHLLPRGGTALDLACGLGGNALFLARRGLDTHAWDIAEEALLRVARAARRDGIELSLQARDVTARPPDPESFDVIVVSRFLVRELAPALIRALRPGGLLFYQTFSREAVSDDGPRRPEFRLAPNELLRLFAGLHMLVYREEGTAGDTARGWRNEAMLVGQARPPRP